MAIAPSVPAIAGAETFELTGSAPATVYASPSTNCLRMGCGINSASGYTFGSLLAGVTPGSYGGYGPELPPLNASSAKAVPAVAGGPAGSADWDNGEGLISDGPWINKPDEGMTNGAPNPASLGSTAYLGGYTVVQSYGAPQSTLFSPNRQISSPVTFGSLPVGFDKPWQTLLFRPATLPGYHAPVSYTHPGNANPATTIPDHLLLDLFWMPIVEPYGISEPFATSGKINLNTQLAPFTYITRTTGLRAVLKSVMITALNPNAPGSGGAFIGKYKGSLTFGTSPSTVNTNVYTHYAIDLDQTLGQLTNPSPDSSNNFPEFARSAHSAATPNFFVSASQICDVPLIPLGPNGARYTNATLASFWAQNALTGDNSLERPYSMIYPRVTTKSNIFTVHVLAQSLKKIASNPQNVWNEPSGTGISGVAPDQILSEFRAAYTIEKYFDPNSDDITDSKGNNLASSNDGTIDPTAAIRNTKWRVLSVKRFGQ